MRGSRGWGKRRERRTCADAATVRTHCVRWGSCRRGCRTFPTMRARGQLFTHRRRRGSLQKVASPRFGTRCARAERKVEARRDSPGACRGISLQSSCRCEGLSYTRFRQDGRKDRSSNRARLAWGTWRPALRQQYILSDQSMVAALCLKSVVKCLQHFKRGLTLPRRQHRQQWSGRTTRLCRQAYMQMNHYNAGPLDVWASEKPGSP